MRETTVLTVHPVRPGGHAYYVDELVPGRAEGSRLTGERPGSWVGPGTPALGLTGTVEREPFAELLAGRHPRSGDRPRPGPTAGRGGRLRPDLRRAEVGQPARRAGPVGGGPGRRSTATTPPWPPPPATWVVGPSGSAGPRRERSGSCRPPAWWPGPSPTGPAGPSTPTSTPTWWWPTSPTGWTAAGRPSTGDGSSATCRPPDSSTGRTSAASSRTRLGVAWEVSERGMGDVVGVDPALRLLFSQRRTGIEEQLGARPGRSPVSGPTSPIGPTRTAP